MKRNEILEMVKEAVKFQLGTGSQELTEKTNLYDDTDMDSLDQVELVMALEEDFGFDIPDEEAEKIKTIREAVDYIEKNQEQIK